MITVLRRPPPPITDVNPLDLKPKPRIWTQLRSNRNHAIGSPRRLGVCRVELVHDAPFAVAIGACVLNTVVFPVSYDVGDEDVVGAAIDADDARLAVMAIISFIPYFNWLSWVFAWMDSGKQRYLVYSIVYLAPYLRTNLSLSPEESWLPIASIVICILHVQLEASIKNGDFEGLRMFSEALRILSPRSNTKEMERKSKKTSTKKGKKQRKMELPSEQGSRENIREWEIPKRSIDELHHFNDDPDLDAKDKSD